MVEPALNLSEKQEKNFQKYKLLGLAKLELCRDSNGITFIKDLKTNPPLLVQKAIYPNSDFSNLAHIYIMSSSGGILQDDKLLIEIEAGKNTRSHITTQAATKIYKMEKAYASQNVDLFLHNGSYLEYLPFQIIPYKSSSYYQTVNVKMEKNSTLLYSEIISAGRTASGEKFDMNLLYLKMNVHDSSDKILFSDFMKIEPKNNKKDLENLFGSKTILATTYVVSNKLDLETLQNQLSAILKPPLLGGFSLLPHHCGIIIRILSDSIDEILSVNHSVAELTRDEILN